MKRIGMRRRKLVDVVVEVFAGRLGELIGERRPAEDVRPDAKISTCDYYDFFPTDRVDMVRASVALPKQLSRLSVAWVTIC